MTAMEAKTTLETIHSAMQCERREAARDRLQYELQAYTWRNRCIVASAAIIVLLGLVVYLTVH